MASRFAIAISVAVALVGVIAYLLVLSQPISAPTRPKFTQEPEEFKNAIDDTIDTGVAAVEILKGQSDVKDLPLSIMRVANSVTKKRLEPWLTDFLSQPKPGDPIQEYEIVAFDDDLFTKIRYGEESTFRFHVNDKYSYLITAESILDFEGGWLLNGYLPNRPDMSAAKIIIADDGSKMGDVFVMRIGRFEINATSELPYHIVYLSTGTYDID